MYNEIEKRHLIELTISSIGDKATSRYNYKRVDAQELAEIIDYAIENGTYIDVINGYHVSVDIPGRIKRYIFRKREELILKYFPESTYVAYPNSDIASIDTAEYDNIPSDNFMIKHIQKYNGSVNFDDTTLYICKGNNICIRRKHNVISATGKVRNVYGKLININVNYCKSCSIYFIDYDEYVYYRDKHGALLGDFIFEGVIENTNSSYGELSSNSILNIMGYSVGQAKNYGNAERRLILKNIIDRGILDKMQIINYLHFFINNAISRKNMFMSVSKWEADLDWVRKYNIEKQRKFQVKRVVNKRPLHHKHA